MNHLQAQLIDAADSALLIVDIQEKFRNVISEFDAVMHRTEILTKAAVRLNVPVLITEQYPKALGPTIPELKQLLPETQSYHSKFCFSAAGSDGMIADLKASGKKQVILCGVETHVCVLQTALELIAAGYAVYLVVDAVGSRFPNDKALALGRLEKAGVVGVGTEMILFEWLRVAGTPLFKELQALIK